MTYNSIEELQQALYDQNYVAERSLVTAVYLSMKLGKPLFLEGEPGVGKTEIAKVIAAMLDTNLIRLQCYEAVSYTHLTLPTILLV